MRGVRTAPSLTVWETGSGGANDAYTQTIPDLKSGAATILDPSTPAATVAVYAGILCTEVLQADEEPPPVALSDYNAALSEFLQGSQILHTEIAAGNEPGALASATPHVKAGLADLTTFLTAIGK